MTGTQPRIELYVRSLLPDGASNRQEAVIEQLQRLDAEDEIADFSVAICFPQTITEKSAMSSLRFSVSRRSMTASCRSWAPFGTSDRT